MAHPNLAIRGSLMVEMDFGGVCGSGDGSGAGASTQQDDPPQGHLSQVDEVQRSKDTPAADMAVHWPATNITVTIKYATNLHITFAYHP